jgi:hypothetical protein
MLAYAAIVAKQIARTCNDYVTASTCITTRALCKTLQTTSLRNYYVIQSLRYTPTEYRDAAASKPQTVHK